MIHLSKIVILILCLSATTAFSQKTKPAAPDNFQNQYNTVNASKDKVVYLKAFLENVKTKPILFGRSPKLVRDSVNQILQLEYNVMLLAVFTNVKDKATIKIKESTGQAYHIAMQTINGEQLTEQRKRLLNQLVAETYRLIDEYHFLQ